MTDTQRVFELLVQITDCCDRLGVPYDLGFYPLRLAMTTEILPQGITSLEILVPLDSLSHLKGALVQEPGLQVEDLEENPRYGDCCVKVSSCRSTFIDLMHVSLSHTYGYAVYITAVVMENCPSEQKIMLSGQCDVARRNVLYAKPFHGLLYLWRTRRPIQIRINPGRARLLRRRYIKCNLPAGYFQGHTQVQLNGRSFSAVLDPESFLKHYYKKPLSDYPVVGRRDKNRLIQQPDIPSVPWAFGKAVTIKLCDKLLGLLNRPIKRCFLVINRQKRFYFRTLDRFQLTDLYAPLKESYQAAYAKQDWEALGDFFAPYLEVVRKYQRYNMPFAFDGECYDILIDLLVHTTPQVELLYNTSPQARLCKWLVKMRDRAFAYLEYVSSYPKSMG